MNKTALMLAVLLLPLASAFGVSPAGTQLFDPAQESFTLDVINTGDEDLTLQVRAEGDAAQFLRVQASQLSLSPGQERRAVDVEVDVPADALPGTYTGSVLVEERREPAPGENVVTAVSAVAHRVEIIVPNQGKFIRTRVSTSTRAAGTAADVTVSAQNIGTQDINAVRSRVEIRANDELVEEVRTQEESLGVGERVNLVAQWTPPSAGEYELRATTTYDGRTQTTSTLAQVGLLDLRVGEPRISDFTLGDVARIDIPVTSTWNAPLRNVNAQLRVTDSDGRLVDSFPSVSTDIAALGDAEITGYWNTAGVSPGSYDVQAVINFPPRQKTVQFSISAGVQGAQISEPGRTRGLWVALGVGVLALVAYLLIMFINKRRSSPNKEGEHDR